MCYLVLLGGAGACFPLAGPLLSCTTVDLLLKENQSIHELKFNFVPTIKQIPTQLIKKIDE